MAQLRSLHSGQVVNLHLSRPDPKQSVTAFAVLAAAQAGLNVSQKKAGSAERLGDY